MYYDLKTSFSEMGVQTFSVTRETQANIINDTSDFNIQKEKDRVPLFKPRRFSGPLKKWWDQKVERDVYQKALKECDIFIFFWETFHRDHSDLAELKRAGKKVFNVFVGDDARWYYGMKQEFESYHMLPMEYDKSYDYSVKGLESRLKLLRNAEAHADFIFSRLDQAQIELRPYYRWNMMVNSKKFIHRPQQREIPIVAHAPSNRAIKGTKTVLEVFDRLKKEGLNFEVMLIENVPNAKAIEMFGSADILIDQLYCPGTGKLSTEALASGTIVMSHMAYDRYPQKNPQECPIIDANTLNLYDQLKSLIPDLSRREKLAAQGRPYVEKYLDVSIFCQRILSLAKGEKIEYDYEPTFFREKFIPESEESKSIYNKWTKVVSQTDWYKKRVRSGERSGLIF
jgi:hypothetical protein